MGNRERVSTILSLRSTLGRWQLNGRAFLNDPDVFFLRDENLKLTDTQKYTVLMVNILLGGLVFTSDFVGDFSDKKWAGFNHVFEYQNVKVITVKNRGRDFYEIEFLKNGENKIALINLGEHQRNPIFKSKKITLKPFETQVLV